VPFLRVIRDKRGYETTYLMHWYREGSKQRSRILYVFRTPGGIRVGRDPFEPEILRTLESQHPDIAFDWKSVLANRQIIESAPEVRRRKRRTSEGEATAAPVETGAAEPASPLSAPAASPRGQQPAAPRLSIPSGLQGATPEEQIAFLNHWYPLIKERIPIRTADATRQEALLALAERLNTAAWTDADQIAAGLVRAGEALERLSRVFSRRRRRSRRPAKNVTEAQAEQGTPSAEPTTPSAEPARPSAEPATPSAELRTHSDEPPTPTDT
jgi:hypothetical protein